MSLFFTRFRGGYNAPMDYLRRAVELSKASFEAGKFPAGAVLVTKSGNVYESKPSVPHNHGESMVIDMAAIAEGTPLTGAILYASMQPCLMCAAKMFWTDVETVHYAIPKKAVREDYAYENADDVEKVTKTFFKRITMTHVPEFAEQALAIYDAWVTKIEGNTS